MLTVRMPTDADVLDAMTCSSKCGLKSTKCLTRTVLTRTVLIKWIFCIVFMSNKCEDCLGALIDWGLGSGPHVLEQHGCPLRDSCWDHSTLNCNWKRSNAPLIAPDCPSQPCSHIHEPDNSSSGNTGSSLCQVLSCIGLVFIFQCASNLALHAVSEKTSQLVNDFLMSFNFALNLFAFACLIFDQHDPDCFAIFCLCTLTQPFVSVVFALNVSGVNLCWITFPFNKWTWAISKCLCQEFCCPCTQGDHNVMLLSHNKMFLVTMTWVSTLDFMMIKSWLAPTEHENPCNLFCIRSLLVSTMCWAILVAVSSKASKLLWDVFPEPRPWIMNAPRQSQLSLCLFDWIKIQKIKSIKTVLVPCHVDFSSHIEPHVNAFKTSATVDTLTGLKPKWSLTHLFCFCQGMPWCVWEKVTNHLNYPQGVSLWFTSVCHRTIELMTRLQLNDQSTCPGKWLKAGKTESNANKDHQIDDCCTKSRNHLNCLNNGIVKEWLPQGHHLPHCHCLPPQVLPQEHIQANETKVWWHHQSWNGHMGCLDQRQAQSQPEQIGNDQSKRLPFWIVETFTASNCKQRTWTEQWWETKSKQEQLPLFENLHWFPHSESPSCSWARAQTTNDWQNQLHKIIAQKHSAWPRQKWSHHRIAFLTMSHWHLHPHGHPPSRKTSKTNVECQQRIKCLILLERQAFEWWLCFPWLGITFQPFFIHWHAPFCFGSPCEPGWLGWADSLCQQIAHPCCGIAETRRQPPHIACWVIRFDGSFCGETLRSRNNNELHSPAVLATAATFLTPPLVWSLKHQRTKTMEQTKSYSEPSHFPVNFCFFGDRQNFWTNMCISSVEKTQFTFWMRLQLTGQICPWGVCAAGFVWVLPFTFLHSQGIPDAFWVVLCLEVFGKHNSEPKATRHGHHTSQETIISPSNKVRKPICATGTKVSMVKSKILPTLGPVALTQMHSSMLDGSLLWAAMHWAKVTMPEGSTSKMLTVAAMLLVTWAFPLWRTNQQAALWTLGTNGETLVRAQFLLNEWDETAPLLPDPMGFSPKASATKRKPLLSKWNPKGVVLTKKSIVGSAQIQILWGPSKVMTKSCPWVWIQSDWEKRQKVEGWWVPAEGCKSSWELAQLCNNFQWSGNWWIHQSQH